MDLALKKAMPLSIALFRSDVYQKLYFTPSMAEVSL